MVFLDELDFFRLYLYYPAYRNRETGSYYVLYKNTHPRAVIKTFALVETTMYPNNAKNARTKTRPKKLQKINRFYLKLMQNNEPSFVYKIEN